MVLLWGILFPARCSSRPLQGIDQHSPAMRQTCLSTCLCASSKSHEGQLSWRVRHRRERDLQQAVRGSPFLCFSSNIAWAREDVEPLLSPKSFSNRKLVIILHPLSFGWKGNECRGPCSRYFFSNEPQWYRRGSLEVCGYYSDVLTKCSFSLLVQTFQSDSQNKKLRKMFIQSCRPHAVKSPWSETLDEKAFAWQSW